jgi:dTDP-glucose 4,6-dehydratase
MSLYRTCYNLLVTGGAGFIGTNFIRYLFGLPEFKGRVINLDKLTYAGNPANLADIAAAQGDRYHLERVDICNAEAVQSIFERYQIDAVVHFAAESHVDRSILGPREFVNTNVMGTFALLEAALAAWKERRDVLFHHVSTDEVYGSLGAEGLFTETTPYSPRSPYSASKAASDHLVFAYHHTYGLPVTLSNCSNNYGPYQFPEKLIPLMILNMLEGKSLPVYGEGKNVRDWLYVEDHASAIWAIMTHAKVGETYNVGGETEWRNIDLVHRLCEIVAEETCKPASTYTSLIKFVADRLGHDQRYAIDCSKLKRDLGWSQAQDFTDGLRTTVRWYLQHREWIANVRTGEYRKWIDANYTKSGRN